MVTAWLRKMATILASVKQVSKTVQTKNIAYQLNFKATVNIFKFLNISNPFMYNKNCFKLMKHQIKASYLFIDF